MRRSFLSTALLLPLLAGCDSSDPDFETPPPSPGVDPSIADLVVDAEDFSTLATAVLEADLAEALSGDGPSTVFAPDDEGFADLLAALGVTAAELLAREDLAMILQLHVLSSLWTAASGSTPTTRAASLTRASSWPTSKRKTASPT